MRWLSRRLSAEEQARRAYTEEYQRLLREHQEVLGSLVEMVRDSPSDGQEAMEDLTKRSDELRRDTLRLLAEMDQFAQDHSDTAFGDFVAQQRQILAQSGPGGSR